MTSLLRWLSRRMGIDAAHSAKADRHVGFEQLARVEREGEAWHVVSRAGHSVIAVVAPHGGGIEPGTSELARAIAGSDHALYLFEGLKRFGNDRLHVKSTRFDEPRLAGIVNQVDTVIALHGERSRERIVYVGGLHEELRDRIGKRLRDGGFEIGKHAVLAGLEPSNVCNRGRCAHGVQLEISEGLRRSMFASLRRHGRKFPTAAFDRFIAAVSAGVG